jgi:predicted glycoside hydrolase/deacetylase ChbG (UPF0249 family)
MRVPFPRRETDFADPSLMSGWAADVSEAQVKTMWQANVQRLAEQPVTAPDRFIVGFFGDNVSIEYLLNVLDRLPDGVSELMTHPGYSDETLVAESDYAELRETELAILTDPRVRQRVAERGIELITYAAL